MVVESAPKGPSTPTYWPRPLADIEDMSLSDEDFQNIGDMVVARIHAYLKAKEA